MTVCSEDNVMTGSYLGNAEKTRLPHGLRLVVSKVFIVLTADDRRKLSQSILWVFPKQDGRLLLTARWRNRETFSTPMLGQGHRLVALRHQTNDGLH